MIKSHTESTAVVVCYLSNIFPSLHASVSAKHRTSSRAENAVADRNFNHEVVGIALSVLLAEGDDDAGNCKRDVDFNRVLVAQIKRELYQTDGGSEDG